jgi:signal-transduction protein with cAMP-binding, CBS, and nucleotidyltransferase domain
MRAREAIRRAPVTAAPETSVAEIAKTMNDAVVGAVVIVEGGAPIGIVTDRDLVTRVVAQGIDVESPVIDVMSINLVTLDAGADLRDAIPLFASHAVRRLPLVDEGQMVGMLSLDDLIIDVVFDLSSLVRPLVGEVIFGHTEPDHSADR